MNSNNQSAFILSVLSCFSQVLFQHLYVYTNVQIVQSDESIYIQGNNVLRKRRIPNGDICSLIHRCRNNLVIGGPSSVVLTRHICSVAGNSKSWEAMVPLTPVPMPLQYLSFCLVCLLSVCLPVCLFVCLSI